MSRPIPVDISDSDSDAAPPHSHVITTPSPKRQKTQHPSSVFLIDDDPSPCQQTGPASVIVPETPLSVYSDSDVAIVTRFPDPQFRDSGVRGLIFLESDDESGKGSEAQLLVPSEKSDFVLNVKKYPQQGQSEKFDLVHDVENDLELSPRLLDTSSSIGKHNLGQTFSSSPLPISSEDGMTQVNDLSTEENDGWERNNVEKRTKSKDTINKDKDGGGKRRKKLTDEEKLRQKEEKKQQKEEEKLQKEAMKAEAAELKKLQKEKQKWEKGKFAQKSIVAEVDTKIVELGSVAGPLLTRFAEKGFTYRITKNPIARSIVWNMTVPEEISQLMSDKTEVSYVLLVFEAEEFCNLVLDESLMDHISSVRSRYPSHTICYLINRLMSYINRREQIQYKNPEKSSGWKRPPVEEVLAQLTTHFVRVHSRLCVDENELAEHVVGLTNSLASCSYRKRLTRLSVNANGSLVPKDCVDKNLIKKNTWLKALVAIPKVQPRFAIAIWKKYPTMKSLLSVYMDPNKSVHEKEFLLKDLKTEVLLGDDRRLGEVCSKRVYRILMAQCGTIKTDEVEEGADFFHSDILNNDESYFEDDLGSCDRHHSKTARGRGTQGK